MLDDRTRGTDAAVMQIDLVLPLLCVECYEPGADHVDKELVKWGTPDVNESHEAWCLIDWHIMDHDSWWTLVEIQHCPACGTRFVEEATASGCVKTDCEERAVVRVGIFGSPKQPLYCQDHALEALEGGSGSDVVMSPLR